MRLIAVLALMLIASPVLAADNKPVTINCAFTVSAAQYAALEAEAAKLSTEEQPLTVSVLCSIWALQQAQARADAVLRVLLDEALVAEQQKPSAERPLTDAAVAAAVAVKVKVAAPVEPMEERP